MFHSTADRYWMNKHDAELLHAGEATLNDRREPGVALFYNRHVKFVLPITEARRIADQLHDKADKAEAIHDKRQRDDT